MGENIEELKLLVKLAGDLSISAYKVVNADSIDLSDRIKEMKIALVKYDEEQIKILIRKINN